ncbi:isochorismatase family protein [Domibacillus epiphyticus]|uniref:isochorismatase family protein n=1 Tax=Domibacillus epiphyticus TaxID=1714355 RepID=UPI001E615D69|nr:isochorismatase family protein [Domibacillus epiphyticus]
MGEEDKKRFLKSNMGGTRGFGKAPALLIVDMTYGFTDSKFRLGHSESGYPAVEATSRLLERSRRKMIPIFFTIPFSESHPSGIGLWKGGERKTDEENTIVTQLKPRDNEVVLQKRRPSAFFGTSLVDMLIFHGIDSLIITGLTTSGCVRASVVDAFSYNYKVIVPEECVGDRSQISHKTSLMDIHMKYGDVIKMDDIMEWMDQNLL